MNKALKWGDPKLYWPEIEGSPDVPVVIVCGPPASGKSTYVENNKAPGDIQIDMDQIVTETGGASRTSSRAARIEALMERNRRLQDAVTHAKTGTIWFVTTCPRPRDRERWSRQLHTTDIRLIKPSIAKCVERINNNPDRKANQYTQMQILYKWWNQYQPSSLDRVLDIA